MPERTFTLTNKTQLTHDVYELIFEGDTSDFTAPGQFVNITVDGLYLRRPISVCDINKELLTLVVKEVGAGTKELCSSLTGDKYDMLTALGNGFDVKKAAKFCVAAGGGVGTPPLYMLTKELLKQGKTVSAAFGFNSEKDVFYTQKFKDLGVEVNTATVDGTFGIKGFVTDAYAKCEPCFDYVLTCGPQAMLKAVYGDARFKDGQFSFEERMGCGFGACMGCSCETKYGYKRICTDGPVLFREEIIW